MDEIIKPISIEDVVFVNDDIYFFAKEYNALYCKAPDKEFAEKVCTIPKESLTGYRLYKYIFYFLGKLYLIPLSAQHIAEYDVIKKSIQVYKIEEEIKNNKLKFSSACRVNNVIYMFSVMSPEVYSFDVVSKEIKCICTIGQDVLNKYMFSGSVLYFTQKSICVNNALYGLFASDNVIFKLNLIDYSYRLFSLGKSGVGHCGIAYCDDKFYIGTMSRDESSLSWKEDGRIEYIDTGSRIISDVYIDNRKPLFCDAAEIGFTKDTEEGMVLYDHKNKVIRIIEEGNMVEISTKVKLYSNEIIEMMSISDSISENVIIDLVDFLRVL